MSDTPTYTAARAIEAEGARVGIVTCEVCGAALLVDPMDAPLNVFKLHNEWHAASLAAPDSERTEVGT